MLKLFKRQRPAPMGLPVVNAVDPYWLQRVERRCWMQARGIRQPQPLWGRRHGNA